MGNIITAEDFFVGILEEIKEDNKILLYNRVVENGGLNNYFETCNDTKMIIPILQKVNKYFLKNCEIHIDKDLIIRPIETEIYFSKINENKKPDDGMCHMNVLQKGKNRFSKLYFHTYKNNISKPREEDKIDTLKGGIDVCISNGEYYLSILIRGAYINGKLFCGINKIMQEILKIEQGKEVTRKNLNCIEEKKVLFSREDKYKNYKFFIYQNRIIKNKYSIDKMPLNIIVNDLNIFEEIYKKDNNNIVNEIRLFYGRNEFIKTLLINLQKNS